MSPDGNVGDTGLKDVPEQVEQEGQASRSSDSRGGGVEVEILDGTATITAEIQEEDSADGSSASIHVTERSLKFKRSSQATYDGSRLLASQAPNQPNKFAFGGTPSAALGQSHHPQLQGRPKFIHKGQRHAPHSTSNQKALLKPELRPHDNGSGHVVGGRNHETVVGDGAAIGGQKEGLRHPHRRSPRQP